MLDFSEQSTIDRTIVKSFFSEAKFKRDEYIKTFKLLQLKHKDKNNNLTELKISGPEVIYYLDNNEFIIDYTTKVQNESAKLNKEFILTRIRDKKKDLENTEEKLKLFRENNRSIKDSPQLQLELERLLRDVEINTEVFITLNQQYEISRIEEQKQTPSIIILDYPIKSVEKDGYSSIQMGYLEKAPRHTNKSEKGHFNKAKVTAKKILKEIAFQDLENVELGQKITAELFEAGDFVAVSGVSKGKGFAGHMKRHGFSGGRRSHGKNSVMRKAGSIGAGSDPSRVWPGTRMAGRMGNENVTVKNLEVTRVEKDKNLVFIKGAVPGANNGIVFISKI